MISALGRAASGLRDAVLPADPPLGTDVVGDMVTLIVARGAFAANAASFRTAAAAEHTVQTLIG